MRKETATMMMTRAISDARREVAALADGADGRASWPRGRPWPRQQARRRWHSADVITPAAPAAFPNPAGADPNRAPGRRRLCAA